MGTALSLIVQTVQDEEGPLWQQLPEEGSSVFQTGSNGNAFSPDPGHVKRSKNSGGWSESSSGGEQLCARLPCT